VRQLQVVGLADDASSVILEDPVRHERFHVVCDERLRAAARADVRRLDQMEIETTSPLRPRDIQARVRAGETPEQVAATAGVSASQVERFAYPVLLERSRVAELAARAHPLRGDRPDPRTLGEIASTTFAARGQDYNEALWDAWKGENSGWVVALAWRAGRSDNVAHWTFRPGPSGGTLAARDAAAHEIAGSEPPSGPRRADGRSSRTAPELPLDAFIQGAPGVDEQRADAVEAAHTEDDVPDALVANGEDLPLPSSPAPREPREPREPRDRPHRPGRNRPAPPTPGAAPALSDESGDPGDEASSRRAKRRHPIVPSWEDVLLGVRSPRA